ncbi:NAD-dependent epimerase/dehydratase family protein [Mesobacillus foraminis]|uniref:UDP-glucose 4-epimerase n=1 Tax=Mesobacillus foraminis TaxID=279826 RepID=A0A4R2BIJ4_9BACI|nr:NAD-dependent epimerase/dehydratase family protein [Mesobacillus foraminis]TCN26716.1 UDP-glucose 4-epimerase [Mesobacillus foraminis]
MPQKVLVTGGCGFIGSHIADKLVSNGYEVVVVDNLATGRKSNLASPDICFYKCSILDKEFEGIVLKEQPDYIIHQAAQVSVAGSIENVLYDEEVNIRGSINVIEAALKAHTKKIIYASSAAVYGKPEYLPIDTQHPVAPLSPYGISKFSVERYLDVYSSLYDLDYTILRYANVYGPRQDATGEGGVISIFMDQICRGETLTIYGDGEQTRDFIYVGDVARANFRALEMGSRKILNVSTGREISLNQVYEMVREISGGPIEVQYANERPGDIPASVLSNEATQKELGWEPRYTLKEGLRETYHFYALK